jgi:hypothetical protein
MRRTALLLLVFLLGFGCLEDRGYSGTKLETISNTQEGDLDQDGSADYIIYDFTPVAADGAGMNVRRQITVSVQTDSDFTSINPNLTDVDLLLADQALDEFSKSRTQADTACSQAIGLSNVVCSDVTTCSRLCAVGLKCKKISDNYPDALAGSMISYVQDNNQIRSLILDARRMVLEMRNTTPENRDVFIGKLRDIVGRVANINANPLYTYGDFSLCSGSDFGITYLNQALGKIGPYSTQNVSYHYRVLLSVKPSTQAVSDQLGVEVAGVGITDRMPRTAVADSDQVSSIQNFAGSEDALSTMVSWNSAKPNKEGYLFIYEFTSTEPPENVLAGLRTPDLNVKRINLAFLAPTQFFFSLVYGILNNYYIAFGAAIGLTVGMLLFIYNVMVLLFTMVSERAAGATFTTGFRKAFGRTDVRWKTDIVISVLFLAGAFYVSTVMVQQPAAPPPIMESIDFLLKTEFGIVGIGMTVIGVIMLYFAVENITKITILERAYGMVIRQEKDMFLAKASALKDRIKELEGIVEAYSREDFDVSREYDVLTAMKAEKIDAMTKDVTARSKAIIDDDLSKTESAISSLKEKKRLADENWPKWKETIGKMLEENNEVYVSSLVTVPSSLRNWAFGRYVKEAGVEGVVFERDSLKRKKVSPEQLVQDMINKGLVKGAIVMKQDKVILSEFAEGSGTVMSALTVKLVSYLKSLAKNLGQHQPQSFVVQGERVVVVLMKNRTVDSVLFLSKDKFKDAIEQWKTKIKAFEGG